jgi:flagellar hook protein FlgE
MGFQTGLSGLNTSSKNLDVIGNNVANSGTVGFKTSQAQFADVFAASLAGAGASQIGIGTKLAAVAQQFTQGNITATNNPLDVAINGKGFFRLDNNGAISYTRNGQFQLDKEGYIVASNGYSNLTGYQADPTTGVITGELGPLKIDTANISPAATGHNPDGSVLPATTPGAVVGVNLDANAIKIDPATGLPDLVAHAPWTLAAPPVLPPANADPATYKSTSTTVYDSLGNSHVMSLYFHHLDPVATPNQWEVYTMIDGDPALTTAGNPATLTFTSGGVVSPAVPFTDYSFTLSNGATTTLDFSVDYNKSTQFASKFGVNELTQTGYASGQLAGFVIGSDGIVQGRYTNGQTKNMGQVALTNFANPQGLQPLGDNQWVESPSSGQALVGQPGSSSLGVLQSAATEDSNVDLTAELVNMIVAQRAYQANAQTIKTQDAVLQTLVNLR